MTKEEKGKKRGFLSGCIAEVCQCIMYICQLPGDAGDTASEPHILSVGSSASQSLSGQMSACFRDSHNTL